MRALVRLLILGQLLSAEPLQAQARPEGQSELRAQIETAMAKGDGGALERLEATITAASTAQPKDPWLLYDLGYLLHRRASLFLAAQKPKLARPFLDRADRTLERCIALGGGGTAIALRGAVAGQLAGASGTLGAIRNGPRSLKLLDQARAAVPNDPRAALLRGMTLYYTPAAFGGGPAKAEPDLRRAVALFATDSARAPQPTWGRTDAHLWLGIVLRDLKRPAEARREWREVLALSPGYRLVADSLLPSLDAPRR